MAKTYRHRNADGMESVPSSWPRHGFTAKMKGDRRRREESPLTAQPAGYDSTHGDGCYRAWTPPEEER